MTDSPLSTDRIAALLEAAAAAIVAEFEALGPDARWRPALGEWSANETLGHLIEAEIRGFNGRVRTLAEWAHHDRNHVKQILSIAQSRVWPQMGNARRFSDPAA